MTTHSGSFVSNTAEFTVSLSELSPGSLLSSHWLKRLCDFDIEVVGNDAEVTLEAVGPFPTSTPFDVSGTTFAIGGGKVSIENFAVAEFVFTRVGTTEYTINIVRRILE